MRGHGQAEVTATGPRGEIGPAIMRMDSEPPRLRVQITGCVFWGNRAFGLLQTVLTHSAALYVIIGAMPCRFLHGL